MDSAWGTNPKCSSNKEIAVGRIPFAIFTFIYYIGVFLFKFKFIFLGSYKHPIVVRSIVYRKVHILS